VGLRLGPYARRAGRPLLVSLLLAALMVARSGEATGLAQTPAGGEIEVTPLVASVLAPPQPVLGADDESHLAYELLVMNLSPDTVRIQAVDTLDVGSQERVVAALTGARLASALVPFVGSEGSPVGPAQVSRVFMDLTVPAGVTLPARIAHRFAITQVAPDGTATPMMIVSGATEVRQQAAVVLDPPLVGNRWVVGNGCCLPPTSHRLATMGLNGAIHVPERFAIDFVQLDSAGRLYTGASDALSSYAFFGVPVYAAADGVVVGVMDGLPEQVPGSITPDINARTAGGNYVVTDLGNGRFAFYAHLQPGGLRVQVGEAVTRGQVLGLLGNTGNSTAPHLHFHVMDGPIPLASNGLPFVFRSFDSEGTITIPLDDLFEGRPAVIGPALAGRHANQLPLDNQVVGFPTPGASEQGADSAGVGTR
jgi:hypothetical protein